jgi:hypothetical protein
MAEGRRKKTEDSAAAGRASGKFDRRGNFFEF